jgi:hypothetical protein
MMGLAVAQDVGSYMDWHFGLGKRLFPSCWEAGLKYTLQCTCSVVMRDDQTLYDALVIE